MNIELTITVYHLYHIFIKIKKLFIKGCFCAFVSFKIRNQNLLLNLKHIQKKVYNNSINISIIPMNVIIIIYIKYQILASMFGFQWSKPKANIINQILQYQIIIHESAIKNRKQCGITKSMQEVYCPNCQVFKLECAECFEKMKKCNNHVRVNLKKFCQQKSIQYTNLSKSFQNAQKDIQEQLKQKPDQRIVDQITQLHNANSILYKQFRKLYQSTQKIYFDNLTTLKINKEEKLKKQKQKLFSSIKYNNQMYQFCFNRKKQTTFQQILKTTIQQVNTQIMHLKYQKQQEQKNLRQSYYSGLIQNLLLKINSNINIQKISLIKLLDQRQMKIKQLQKQLSIMSNNLMKYSKAQSIIFTNTRISSQELIVINTEDKNNQFMQRIRQLSQQNERLKKNKFNENSNLNMGILKKIQQNQKYIVLQELLEKYKNQILGLKKDKTELQNKLQNQKIQYQNKLIQQKWLYDNQIVINNIDDQKIQNYQKNINQQKVIQLEQLKIKYGRLNQQVDRLTNQNNLIKQQGITKDKEIINLKNQIQKNIQNEKNENIENVKQVQDKIQEIKNTHQQEKQKLQNHVAEYLQKISKLQKQKKELELYVQKQPQRIQKENHKIEQQHKIKYQQKILQQKQKFQQQSTKYQQRISQLQNKKQQLQLKITKLQQEKQKLKLRITKLQSEEQYLQKQQQKLRSQSIIMIQKQKQEIMFQFLSNKLQKQITCDKNKIKQLQKIYANQKQASQIERGNIRQYQEKQLNDKLIDLQHENQQLRFKQKELKQQLHTITYQNRLIKQQCNLKDKQIIDQKQLLQKLNDSIKQKNKNIENFYKIVNAAKSQKQGLQKDLQNLKVVISNILRYQKKNLIGEGGQAIIYECIDHQQPQQKKILRLSTLGKECLSVQKTLQEPEILSKLDHPNIIKVQKYWKCENYFIGYSKPIKSISMVMEYIQTGDLQKYIGDKRKFSYYDVRLIYQNLKSALQYLYSNKIIHRDITRRNILIKEENSIIIKAVLTDFGISSVIQAFKTRQFTKNYLATDYYRAPQFFLQKLQISFATDLWNFGIVMIELILGRFIQDLRQKQPGLCTDFPQIELDLINKNDQYCNFVPMLKQLLEKDPKKREMIQL